MPTSETPPQTVAIIGPRFGTASQAIEAAVRNHVGDENVRSLWYEESAFERPLGRLVGRLVRVIVQALPLPQGARALSERFIGIIRFRRNEVVAAQLAWARSIGALDHLILVKPAFLKRADLQAIRQAVHAQAVSIVLWDARWRTPSIEHLTQNAKVFSTEPTDCERYGYSPLPVPPIKSAKSVVSSCSKENLTISPHSTVWTNIDGPLRVFFCGSWSLDRWLAARNILTAARSIESTIEGDSVGLRPRRQVVCELHLVTTNWFTVWVSKLLPVQVKPLGVTDYEQSVERCDVLVDLGRAGQSSPSERLHSARRSGKLLLTANSSLKQLGFPVIVVENSNWYSALFSCVRVAHHDAQIEQAWDEQTGVDGFMVTSEVWANSVLALPNDMNLATPTEEISEPPFSSCS